MLRSLADWPPILVYLLVALSCAVENFFPPSPSDVFVVTAAFLSHGGHYDPLAIFMTAWAGGVAGSMIVFQFARRHADRLTNSKLGKMLLPPEATAFLLKEYGRYGMFGMVITRLLPGFRSVVAPFAGLSQLTLRQLVVPVVIATGLWYAFLTWVGARLGDQWDLVIALINRVTGALGVVSIAVAALAVAGIILWRRRRPAR